MMDATNPAEERAEKLRYRLRWFLFFRVLIISCFLGAVAFVHLAANATRWTISTEWLLATIAITYAITIVSALLLSRTRRVHAFAYIQFAIDVLLTTGAVLITGGAESPFPFLYSLTIFNAAILLYVQGAAIAAIFSCAAYTMLVAALVKGVSFGLAFPIPQPPLDAQLASRLLITNASFLVIAYLAGVLTQRLHDAETLLQEHQAKNERLSGLQEALARHVGCGLITTDPEGKITSANSQALALAQADLASVITRNIGSLFPPLHLTSEARVRFLQSTSTASATELRQRHDDGTDLLLRCSAAPLHDTYHHPIGVLYIFQDVTMLRELEQKYRDQGESALDSLPELELDDSDDPTSIDGFVGRSPAMQQVRALIDKVAASDATVLLSGESGTGKEVAARAIHAKSPRVAKSFVAINCGAIPEHLIESELFGHVKGAFTGAVSNRAGFFRVADGGTVFLDEIGELPLALQVKLLRVLQERVFKPVGSESHVAVNVRVIAATNKDLMKEIRAERFREDLFYRLNVISIELPPLRERTTDIPLLIRYFLREFSDLHHKRVVRLSVPAARRLLGYHYPGNVRELANIIEHAVTMADGETAHESHLPPHVLQPPRASAATVAAKPDPLALVGSPTDIPRLNGHGRSTLNLDDYLESHEKAIILHALEQAGGVKKKAASLLGINYRSFRHRLSKYGLNHCPDHAEDEEHSRVA